MESGVRNVMVGTGRQVTFYIIFFLNRAFHPLPRRSPCGIRNIETRRGIFSLICRQEVFATEPIFAPRRLPMGQRDRATILMFGSLYTFRRNLGFRRPWRYHCRQPGNGRWILPKIWACPSPPSAASTATTNPPAWNDRSNRETGSLFFPGAHPARTTAPRVSQARESEPGAAESRPGLGRPFSPTPSPLP